MIGESSDIFRSVNDRILELGAPFVGVFDFVCECGNGHCTGIVSMTAQEYSALRADPTQFAMLPGHELPEFEEAVGRMAHYVLVRRLGRPRSTPRRSKPSSTVVC